MVRRPAILGDEVCADDARAATDALRAVDEHTGVGVAQGIGHKGRRRGEVRGELSEWAVLQREVEAFERDGEREVHATVHRAEDVGDAESEEGLGTLGGGEVGDEEAGDDLGRRELLEGRRGAGEACGGRVPDGGGGRGGRRRRGCEVERADRGHGQGHLLGARLRWGHALTVRAV